MARPRISISALMFLVLALAIGFIALRLASRAWAGVMLFLTLGVLLSAIVGATYRRGSGRAFWLGFALFGWGYMLVTARVWLEDDGPDLITTMLFGRPASRVGRPGAPTAFESVLSQLRTGYDVGDQKILSKLEMLIPMPFPDETPLEDVLKYIKAATQGPNDNGIPIYVDPVGLQEAQKTMTSPVALDLEGLPLKTTLALLLKQLGLTYVVRDGLLEITSRSLSRDDADAFARISHSCMALVVGCIGGLIACGFYATRDRGRALRAARAVGSDRLHQAGQNHETTAPVQLDPAPAVQP